jgi:hypothetical protein
MTAIHETAYPRIRSNLTDKALRELYTPTADDLACIRDATKSAATALGLAILLKTFQRLGYFPVFDALPPRLIDHIAREMGTPPVESSLQQYDVSGYAVNHDLPFLLPLFRSHRKACLDVLELLRPTSTSADTTLEQAMTFILRHRHTRAAQLPIRGDDQGVEAPLGVSWVPPRWWKAVTRRHRRDGPVRTVDR